jgi:hypothetical protein
MVQLIVISTIVFGSWAYISPETFNSVGDTMHAYRCAIGMDSYCK